MSIKSQRCINTALEIAERYLGTDYSRGSDRYKAWPGGSMDCSMYMATVWMLAGMPLLGASGDALLTSTYQVNAVGFDLIYPDERAKIGKNLPSPRGLLADIGRPGDVVFWNFDKSTSRKNKITHIGMVYDDTKIIHTANNKDKCCHKPLSYGERDICAIIRLRDDFAYPSLPEISKPTESGSRPEEWQVRMLQAALNLHHKQQLTVDGLIGTKTVAAITRYNLDVLGIESGVCQYATWEALGFGQNLGGDVPEPEPSDWPIVLRLDKPLMRPDGLAILQDGLGRLGYDCGTADGICGAKTMEGVQAFSRAHTGVG